MSRRVVWTAAFRAPRELIWITGLLLLPLTIVWAVTGNPLSASQKGIAQIDVEGKILASTPLIGPAIQRIVLGGDAAGNLTLTHLYFLHVGLLPILAALLLAIHIGQVHRHAARAADPPVGGMTGRTYWPYQSVRNLIVLSLVVATVVWVAWRYGAPLEAPADPTLPDSPRPEWYFRWLFELRRYFTGSWEFLATLILPLALLLYFLLLPAVDRRLGQRWGALVRGLTVLLGLGGWAGLTWTSLARDWSDQEYLAAQNVARGLADRRGCSRVRTPCRSKAPSRCCGTTRKLRARCYSSGIAPVATRTPMRRAWGSSPKSPLRRTCTVLPGPNGSRDCSLPTSFPVRRTSAKPNSPRAKWPTSSAKCRMRPLTRMRSSSN